MLTDKNTVTEENLSLLRTTFASTMSSLVNCKTLDLYGLWWVDNVAFVNSWNVSGGYLLRLSNSGVKDISSLNRLTGLKLIGIENCPCSINQLNDSILLGILDGIGSSQMSIWREWVPALEISASQAKNFVPPANLTRIYLNSSKVNLDFSNCSGVTSAHFRDSTATMKLDPTYLNELTLYTNHVSFVSGKTGGNITVKLKSFEDLERVCNVFSEVSLFAYETSMDFTNLTNPGKIKTFSNYTTRRGTWTYSGLSVLSNLQSLTLCHFESKMEVSDMSSLNSLSSVSLENTNANILELLPLNKLTTLTISKTALSSLIPLESAKSLTYLSLDKCSVNDYYIVPESDPPVKKYSLAILGNLNAQYNSEVLKNGGTGGVLNTLHILNNNNLITNWDIVLNNNTTKFSDLTWTAKSGF